MAGAGRDASAAVKPGSTLARLQREADRCRTALDRLADRRADGLGNASAARELSALKAFIRFAREQAGMPDPAPPRMRGPRVKKGIPRPVTPDAGSLFEPISGADAVTYALQPTTQAS
mgnify:CR=1 FL=1